jgi:hypothetical protein
VERLTSSDAAVDAFVADVLTAYTRVTGSPQRFQFLQMRVRLRPNRPGDQKPASAEGA